MKHCRVLTALGGVLLVSLVGAPPAIAQCAGCGADYNKADRKATEIERVRQYDKPIRPDPIGNALIGGGVTGSMKGAAAGAAAAARGAAIGTGAEKVREKAQK